MEKTMSYAKLKKIAVAGAMLVMIASPALADGDDDGNDWWPRWGMGGMMGRWNGPMMDFYGPDAMVDRIDGRLAFLKTELKITAEQTPAWDELATTVRDTAETHNKLMRGMMKEFRSGEFFKKPLPDRLILQETHLEARLEQVKQLKAAVDKLYAVLNEEQKRAADEIVLPTMGMGMGMGRGMRFE